MFSTNHSKRSDSETVNNKLGWTIIILVFICYIFLYSPPIRADKVSNSTKLGVILQLEAFIGPAPDYLFEKNKWDIAANKLKELGVEWVRLCIDWRWIQYENKNNFKWDGKSYPYDFVIDSLVSNNFQILGLIAYAPPWSNGGNQGTFPPSNAQDFGDFVFAVVKRYGDRIHYWELWNEPNIPEFWKPSPNVSDYMKLLSAGYNSAKTADPNCKIVSAGLAHSPDILSWLQAMYDNDLSLKDYCDAVGIHAYTWSNISPLSQFHNNSKIGSFNIIEAVFAIMNSNNDHEKEIWLTEQGWEASEVGESLQVKYLSDSIKMLKDKWPFVGAYYWFEFLDHAGTYGLLKNDNTLSKREAYDEYKLILQSVPPKAPTNFRLIF